MVTRARVLDLKDIKAFVLDEADNMLDSGSMGEQSISLKKCASPSIPILPISSLNH